MSNTCTIYLLKNFPINDYGNVYWNGSQADLYNKFINYCTKTENVDMFTLSNINLSLEKIKMPISYVKTFLYNYLIIIDNSTNEKYFCFINGVTWSSNLRSCTIDFEIDIFSTYFHRLTFFESYVERETVNDDTFGKHILDEGLTIHDYSVTDVTKFGEEEYTYALLISSSVGFYGNDVTENSLPNIINVSKNEYSTPIILGTKEKLTQLINALIIDNKVDSIIALYMIPKSAIYVIGEGDYNYCEYRPTTEGQPKIDFLGTLYNNTSPTNFTRFTRNKINTLNGYTPQNNKCFCYPFTVCKITNNCGGSILIKYELCNDNNTVKFDYAYSPLHSANGYGYMVDYEGLQKNNDYSLTTIQNPDLPYVTSQYSAYIASNRNSLQNSLNYIENDVNFERSVAKVDEAQADYNSMIGAIGSALRMDIGGYVGNLNEMVNSRVEYEKTNAKLMYNAQKQRDNIQASLNDMITKPSISHGVFSTNGLLMSNSTGFKFEVLAPEYEEIKSIDLYFKRFGYKVNTFKIPTFLNRINFDYIQLKEVNCTGEIPINEMNKLKAILTNGVTLWHDISKMYNYSDVNSIR